MTDEVRTFSGCGIIRPKVIWLIDPCIAEYVAGVCICPWITNHTENRTGHILNSGAELCLYSVMTNIRIVCRELNTSVVVLVCYFLPTYLG